MKASDGNIGVSPGVPKGGFVVSAWGPETPTGTDGFSALGMTDGPDGNEVVNSD